MRYLLFLVSLYGSIAGSFKQAGQIDVKVIFLKFALFFLKFAFFGSSDKERFVIVIMPRLHSLKN